MAVWQDMAKHIHDTCMAGLTRLVFTFASIYLLFFGPQWVRICPVFHLPTPSLSLLLFDDQPARPACGIFRLLLKVTTTDTKSAYEAFYRITLYPKHLS